MGDQERKGGGGVQIRGIWMPRLPGRKGGDDTCRPLSLFSAHPFAVVISRQRRRVQLMRIRQQEERKEKRRKKRPPRAPSRASRAPPRPGPPDPAYRRRPVPIKRFNGDVLSPVSTPSPSNLNGVKGVYKLHPSRTGLSPGAGHCLEGLVFVPPIKTPAPGA